MQPTPSTTVSATMRTSFTTMATPALELSAQATAVRDYGFDGVDLRVGQLGAGEVPPELDVEAAKNLLQQMNGVPIFSLLCYNQMLHQGEKCFITSLQKSLCLAERLEVPLIRIFTGKIQSETELQQLISSLQSLFRAYSGSVKIGVQIHVNNGVRESQALTICRSISDARLGIILSPDQTVLCGEDEYALLPELAPYVFELYVADLNTDGAFVLPGQGVIDFARILNSLRAGGFDGYVTLKWEKCWIPELPPYPQAFRAFQALMKNIMYKEGTP